MINYRINTRGAAVAGQGNMMLRRFVKDAENTVAVYAEAQVLLRLQRSLKTQTPYYTTRVGIRYRGGVPVVDDGRVIYGPWLEGVGSRNAPVTRFAGYASFRRTAQLVERNAARITEDVWRRSYRARF